MLRSGASDSALGNEIVPIVNARFLTGHKDIPRQVVQCARGVLNSPGDALKPFKYGKGADITSFKQQGCLHHASAVLSWEGACRILAKLWGISAFAWTGYEPMILAACIWQA